MKRFKKFLAALLIAAFCLSMVGALADGVVRTTGNLNLRKGPGLGYKSIRTIGEGVTLEYDKSEKDERGVRWYRVTYKGRTGWVSSKYAREGSSGGSGSKVKTTGSVHMRTGAGLDYKSLRTIGKGVTLSYDETRKDDRGVVWYHVSYKGKSGWVSSKYAKKK
ncbi:MAG: SH3 domain-containing protein [Clostridia bacterium]|nr:SH3 domain-containing protein [Clostridia bacterium]